MDVSSARIGRYVLNSRLGCLEDSQGTAVHLRPKSFRLLEVLADRRGELLSKDALAEAVWANVAVTDESLSQCIRDIRKALGKESAKLLRTVPCRGYVLDPDPSSQPHRVARRLLWGVSGSLATLAAAIFGVAALTVDPLPDAPTGVHAVDPVGTTAFGVAAGGLDWRERQSNDAWREELRAALDKDPENAAAWAGLGLTYWMEVKHVAWGGGRRELDLALDALKRSLQLGGGSPAYRVLAELRLGAPFDDARSKIDALAAARTAVDLTPNEPYSLAILAEALLANGYLAEARPVIERAKARVATPPDRFLEISGIAYLLTGAPAKAVEDFGRLHGAGTFGGTRSYSGWYLAASLAHAGRVHDASAVIDTARRTRPERTLTSVAHSLSRHSDQPSRKIVLDGLKLAGMPD